MVTLKEIKAKVRAGERITPEEGLLLLERAELFELGKMANRIREKKHGDRAYYIVNQHLNYTNICQNECSFCAFFRKDEASGGYAYSVEEALAKLANLSPRVTEIHIVGGCHPDLPFSYYLELLGAIKEKYPNVHLQGFTAVEIAHLARLAGTSVQESLEKLREAGLGSLPGGGAEIFDPRLRQEICPDKITSHEWLSVHRTAHNLGMRTNATMLYGHRESPEQIIDHLDQLRNLQDQTSGFMTFIPLCYHPYNTDLGGDGLTSGIDDLKIYALSRIFLDNFDHIKTFWIMMGPKLSQVALHYGVDDMDGTVVEEKITHAAGAETPQGLTEPELCRLITEAGREPIERDTLYNLIEPD